MTCQQCGEQTQTGDVFCSNCGTRIAPATQSCGVCRTPNPPDAHFCTICGTQFDSAEPASATTQPASASPLPPPATTPPTPTGHSNDRFAEPAAVATGYTLSSPVGLIGGLVAAVGSLLPWLDAFGATRNAFDVPAPYLLDYTTTASDTVTVGLLVVILGGAAVVACVVPRFVQRAAALRALGVALLAAVALFGYQLVRTADDVGVSLGDLAGIGPIVTAIGGIALLFGR